MRYQDRLDQAALDKYAAALNARAKALGVGGRLEAEHLRDRILASGGCCDWCGGSLLDREFELDHVFSLAKRGDNTSGNLAVACVDCNRRKADKHPARFAAEIAHAADAITPLVSGLLRRFQMKSQRQMDLFERERERQEPAIAIDDQARSIPPYNWMD